VKQIVVSLYSYKELSKEAQERAFRDWLKEQEDSDPLEHSLSEMMASLHTLAELISGSKGRDWSVGAYNQNYRYVLRNEPLSEFYHRQNEMDFFAKTPRAKSRRIAWWENNVLASLRITRKEWKEKKFYQYGASYQIGEVKPCPLTGVCYDEDLLEKAKELFIDDAMSWCDVFNQLAKHLGIMAEGELEYLTSREYFEEYEEGEEKYLENGEVSNG
jgi:hypothetical protein